MPEPRAPDNEARLAGRRRTGLFLAGALLLLLLGIPLVGTLEKTSKAESTEAANRSLIVEPGGQPSVMQVRATTKKARAENIHYVLSLDQEVYVDVRAPGMWLRQRMGELGKQDLDPRAKVTLDTVVYDPETAATAEFRMGASCGRLARALLPGSEWPCFPGSEPTSRLRLGRVFQGQFQMIGWNLAFGVIFVRAVYYKLAMPEFSNDQLLLMSISNGTYLGFKWSVSKPDKEGK